MSEPFDWGHHATSVVSAAMLSEIDNRIDSGERPRIRLTVTPHSFRHPNGMRMDTRDMSEVVTVGGIGDYHIGDRLMLRATALNGDPLVLPVSRVTAIAFADDRIPGFSNTDRRTLVDAEDVPEELLDRAVDVADSWYGDGRIDWVDVLDRLDGFEASDGTCLDLGDNLTSPAIRKIKSHVRRIRRESPR